MIHWQRKLGHFPYQHRLSIQEIVLVNQYWPYVEVWQRNEEHPENLKAWHYRHYGAGDTVELASLNIQITMADIYQDLDFADGDEDDEE